jgi:hypothetical protein
MAGMHHRASLLLLAALSCRAAEPGFAQQVWPILDQAGCAGCHQANGVASATRFRLPTAALASERKEEFGRSLHRLIDRAQPERSLLLTKPTARIAHGGGKRIEPGSPQEKTLLAWIQTLAKLDPATLPQSFSESTGAERKPALRRLTHAQYNNTIRDLLGDNSRLADGFPPEDFVHGFRNQYHSQNASPLLAEAYSQAAEKLARKAFAGDTRTLIPCAPSPACRDQFIATFGRRAYRRPLSAAEKLQFTKLFAAQGSFTDGARTVVEAMLQSPNFLFRTENGRDPAQKPFETASRLSYFLWNSMPDEALLTAAAQGQLNTKAGLDAHIQRLLKDEKARGTVDEFIGDWLRFDRVEGAIRDRGQYRDFTPEIKTAMLEETRRLAQHLVWNNGNFMEFFSADYAFLNAGLAKLYNVPEPAQEYERTPLPPATGRAGVLGQATFLTLTSKPGDTSPTARGLFVREQFLCQEVPQPPPGVNSNLPPVTKERPMTNRERLGVHLSNDSCSSCHRLIDPIGFGFEKYDAIGRHRETLKLTVAPAHADRGEKPANFSLPLLADGEVLGIPDSAFTQPSQLGRVLARAPQCQQCVVKQLFRYARGRHEEPDDQPLLDRAYAAFRDSGFRFQTLLAALARD